MFKSVSSAKPRRASRIPRSAQQLGTFEIVAAAVALPPGALLPPECAFVELVAAPEHREERNRPDQEQIEDHQDEQGLDAAEAPGDRHPPVQEGPPERRLLAFHLKLRLCGSPGSGWRRLGPDPAQGPKPVFRRPAVPTTGFCWLSGAKKSNEYDLWPGEWKQNGTLCLLDERAFPSSKSSSQPRKNLTHWV